MRFALCCWSRYAIGLFHDEAFFSNRGITLDKVTLALTQRLAESGGIIHAKERKVARRKENSRKNNVVRCSRFFLACLHLHCGTMILLYVLDAEM